MRAWLGIEVEGRLRGLRTLFVAGPAVPRDALAVEAAARAEGAVHIYLGGGGEPVDAGDVDWPSLARLTLPVTVEVQLSTADRIPAWVSACRSIRPLLSVDVGLSLHALLGAELKLTCGRTQTMAIYANPTWVDYAYAEDKPCQTPS